MLDSQELAEKEGRSLWVGDSGVVRDAKTEYRHIHEDEYVLSTDETLERDVGLGAHEVRIDNLIREVTQRAVEEDQTVAQWMLRLTPEQQIAMKHAALELVTRAFTEAHNTHFSGPGLAQLVKAIGVHVREALAPLYAKFSHHNVHEVYAKTLLPPRKEENLSKADPLDDAPEATDPAQSTDPMARVTSRVSNGAATGLGLDQVSGAQAAGAAATDPVFGARPVAEAPATGLGPLHRTLGLTADPVPAPARLVAPQVRAAVGVVADHARRYARALEKAQAARDEASIAAARVAAATAGANARAGARMAVNAVHPLTPFRGEVVRQIRSRARSAAVFYRDQAKEYARTVRYWRRQTKAVRRLRNRFVRAYNRFVKGVKRDYAGDQAYKAALVHLTAVISQALSVPTKNAKF